MRDELTYEQLKMYGGRRVRIVLQDDPGPWDRKWIKDCEGSFVIQPNTLGVYVVGESGAIWNIIRSEISLGYLKVYLDDDMPWTNKGREKCIFCGCPTESKRDFNTFEVREMCPRCKF